MANLSNINNKFIVDDGGNVLVGSTANLSTYTGISLYGANPSLAIKTSSGSGWIWTQYVNSSGTNNFSMGVNQSIPYWGVGAGAGMGGGTMDLVVDSSGNVGVGTYSPGAKLSVQNTSTAVTSLLLGNNSGSTGDYQQIVFQYSQTDTSYRSAIRSRVQAGGVHGGNLSFWTDQNGTTTLTERMTIDRVGNVGIGTTSPNATLDILGSGNTVINSRGNLFVSSGGTATQVAETGGQISFGSWLNGDLTQPYPLAAIRGVAESSTTNTNTGALIFGTMDSNTTVQERMRIDSSGNVGIGGTLANKKLYVLGDATNYQILAEQPSGYAGFSIKSTTLAQTWSWIANDNGSNSDLLLYGGAAAGTKLTIDSSGNATFEGDVGIGRTVGGSTTILDGTKTETGSTAVVARFTNNASGSYGSANGHFRLQIGSTSAAQYSPRIDFTDYDAWNGNLSCDKTNGMVFRVQAGVVNGLDPTSLAERMRITSAGNVGIGTDTPDELLHLYKASGNTGLEIEAVSSGDPIIRFVSANNRTGDIFYTDATTLAKFSYDHSAQAFKTYAHNNTTVDFYLSETKAYFPSQDVGIGTTSPGYSLQVGDGSSNIAMGNNATTNGTSRLKFLGSNSVTNWQISHNDSVSGALEFMPSTATGGSTFTTAAVVISSTGNVGIGANSASYKLRVKSDATVDNGIYLSAGTSSSNHALYVENLAGTQEQFAVRGDGEIRLNATSGHTYAAQGIRFGANASANNLDDYEEGTWTGTMDNSGVGNQATGSYTKIGNRVFFEIYFAGVSVTNAGSANVSGFPFTADTNSGYGGAWSWHGNATNNTIVGAYNTGTITRLVDVNSVNIATWKVATVWLMLAGCYKTAS